MFARFSFRNPVAAMLAAPALVGAVSLAASGAALAGPCTGPGAPATTETRCLTAVQIPGNPLRSFDISWVNPHRGEYYLGDRSNTGVDIIDTRTLTFKRTIGGFVGIKLNPLTGAVDNNHSGPDGVVSHGRWLYAGDGDSTLHVIDLDAPSASATKQVLSTGGTTRVDEMALTSDGEVLLTANNAEDPPFGNLFLANGDRNFSSVTPHAKVTIDLAIVPAGAGLSIEQPAWDPKTKRFYVSVPIIANNPAGCNFDGSKGAITCDGGMLVVDPANVQPSYGLFDPVKGGVVKLSQCGPNGATVGPHDNLMLGCTSANNPSNKDTLVINATTQHFVLVGGLVGSDEVWFNKGDGRYYTGSNRQPGGAALGVVNGETNFLIETIPQGSGSHSVAADSKHNFIFVPQVAPLSVVGIGGDTTPVGAGICGSNNGCIAVYSHQVDRDRDDHDRDGDRDDHDHDH
jgi:hypothetical protein